MIWCVRYMCYSTSPFSRERDKWHARISVRPEDVSAMPDAENDDFSPVVVDTVENPIGASPGAPLQLIPQRSAGLPRVVQQRTSDEVDHGERHRLREGFSDRPGRRCATPGQR